jgi:hypothetical protein
MGGNDRNFEADCAPYSRSSPSGTRTFFPKTLRDAWRNGEDPTEHRAAAPGRRFD